MVRSAWTIEQPARSLDELQQKRRHLQLPDPSYELNGDGVVDNSDLFFASMFDEDRDGRLNHDELERCQEALRAGLNKQWRLSSAGPVRVADLDRDQQWMQHAVPEPGSRTASTMRQQRRQDLKSAGESVLGRLPQPVRRAAVVLARRPGSDHLPLDLSHPDAESITTRCSSSSTAATRSDLIQQRHSALSRSAIKHLDQVSNKRPAESLCLGKDPPDYSNDKLTGSNRYPAWHRTCWTPASDPAKSQHVLNRRRQCLAGTIGKMAAPEFEPRSSMLQDLAVRHGIKVSDLCREVRGRSMYEANERARLSEIQRADLLPMYSSFTSDHIFREPHYMQLKQKTRPAEHTCDHVENMFTSWMEKTGAGLRTRPYPGLPIKYAGGDRHQMVSILLSRTKTRCQAAIRSRAFPAAIRTQ